MKLQTSQTAHELYSLELTSCRSLENFGYKSCEAVFLPLLLRQAEGSRGDLWVGDEVAPHTFEER